MEQNNFSNENFLNELLMTFSTYVHTYRQMEKKIVYTMRSYRYLGMGQMSTKQFSELSLCLLIISSENHILREQYSSCNIGLAAPHFREPQWQCLL